MQPAESPTGIRLISIVFLFYSLKIDALLFEIHNDIRRKYSFVRNVMPD